MMDGGGDKNNSEILDFYLRVISGVSSAGNAWYVFVQFQTIPTDQIDELNYLLLSLNY